MPLQRGHFWREPVAAVNVMLGAGLALLAGWAWLVCEARHPGGMSCGPTLAGLLLAGLLHAAAGCVLTFEGAWAALAAAWLEGLALAPAAFFIVGLIAANAFGVAAAAFVCWLVLLAEAAVIGRA